MTTATTTRKPRTRKPRQRPTESYSAYYLKVYRASTEPKKTWTELLVEHGITDPVKQAECYERAKKIWG